MFPVLCYNQLRFIVRRASAAGSTVTLPGGECIVNEYDLTGAMIKTTGSDGTLAGESLPQIAGTHALNYTYDALGRRTGIQLDNGNDYTASYTYDGMSRAATVSDGADTLTFAYRSGLNQLSGMNWTNAAGNNTAYSFNQFHRLTGIAVNNTPVYGYTLNAKDQRTAATLPDGKTWDYSYDGMGQVTGGVKKTAAGAMLDTLAYAYDTIGNRISSTEDGVTRAYTSNNVNQYTALTNPAMSPTYDADGNMLTNGAWNYTWNAENRLICAENTTAGTKLEFAYDFMGRRIFKKSYANNVLTEHQVFVYDGFKQIAAFDALNSDTQIARYLWSPVGQDVPLRAVFGNTACYYIADGNKNIIQLRDATGAVTDSYSYDPFGKVTHTGASENPWQFSSEYHDDATDLVYYNYRYYSPELGRWIKRDPIEEQGGMNLYGMVGNNSVSFCDIFGMTQGCCGKDITLALKLLFEKFDALIEQGEIDLNLWRYYITNGWDIIELQKAGTKNDGEYNPFASKNGETKNSECRRTVSINGKCYKVWAVNYLLWGKIQNAVDKGIKDPYMGTSAVQLYLYMPDKIKGNDEDRGYLRRSFERLFFTMAGYNGDIVSHEKTYILPSLLDNQSSDFILGSGFDHFNLLHQKQPPIPLSSKSAECDCRVNPDDVYNDNLEIMIRHNYTEFQHITVSNVEVKNNKLSNIKVINGSVSER